MTEPVVIATTQQLDLAHCCKPQSRNQKASFPHECQVSSIIKAYLKRGENIRHGFHNTRRGLAQPIMSIGQARKQRSSKEPHRIPIKTETRTRKFSMFPKCKASSEGLTPRTKDYLRRQSEERKKTFENNRKC